MIHYHPVIEGIHTIKVTIQKKDYVGHIFKKKRGRRRGRDILRIDFRDECDDFESDCQLEYDDTENLWWVTLTNENGDTILTTADDDELNGWIVAIEIVDYEERELRVNSWEELD